LRDRVQLAAHARFTQEDSGAVQIETAFSYLLFFLILAGIIQFCMVVYTYGVYAEAARAGVRYAVQHGTDSSTCSGPSTGCSDSTGANVVSAVSTYAAHYVTTIAGMRVQASYPDSSSAPGARVVVKVTYTYAPFVTYKGFNQAFQIAAQGRILY
jgi:Flp pilus assembly protein TadG